MLEILALLIGVAAVAMVFKIGIFLLHLLLLPFKIVGGLLLGLFALPLLLVALPLGLAGGIAALVGVGVLLPVLLVVGGGLALVCVIGLLS